MNALETLLTIKGLFDCGCTIELSDDGICIVGNDYIPDGVDGDPDTTFIERHFEMAWETDDEGNLVDTLPDLLRRINPNISIA